ncbi:MAG: DUF1573 domain-containing protein [Thermoleophilia bacterium]|nr:DUF1573 domain-containing protein [Thermoleophilia bacterium]
MGFIVNFRGKRQGAAILAALGSALALMVLLAGCGEEEASTAVITADTGGRLEISETMYDFGEVPVGELVEHDFELKNTGTGPLHLGELEVKRLEGC